MAIKKYRPKTNKTMKKRVKVTNGGDLKIGKMLTKRPFGNHRLIRRQRVRLLKGKKQTLLSSVHKKLKAVL